MKTKILIIAISIIFIGLGVGLWQGHNVLNIRVNFLHLSLPLSFLIFSAFLLALFFFFWKKLHKSKPWLWGTRIGLFLMIIYFLLLIANMPAGGWYPLHIILWILWLFGMHFLLSLPGILLSGLGPYLFFKGLKKEENIIKRIIFIVFGLLLIPVSLFLLLVVGLITTSGWGG